LGHPCNVKRVSHLGSVTARHSIGRQPNFVALNRLQRVPAIFGRATITLGIGLHSSLFFFFFLFSSPNLSRRRLDVYHTFHTGCGLSANLECMSEMCCTWLTGNAGPKKIARNAPSGHHRTILSGYIFATKACIHNRKKVLNSDSSSTCPNDLVNLAH